MNKIIQLKSDSPYNKKTFEKWSKEARKLLMELEKKDKRSYV